MMSPPVVILGQAEGADPRISIFKTPGQHCFVNLLMKNNFKVSMKNKGMLLHIVDMKKTKKQIMRHYRKGVVQNYLYFCNRFHKYFLPFLFVLSLFQVVFAVDEVVIDNTDSSKTPQLTKTAQGILQIDIVNSKKGLSHNRFESYNSGIKGIIINNSPYGDVVEGLGSVKANPNLNKSASAILFEITGDDGSELNGVITIFGEPAQLIITNPNGIECSNCSFVNGQKVELRSDRLLLITDGQIKWIPDTSHNILMSGSEPIVRNGSLLLSSGRIYLVATQVKVAEIEGSAKDFSNEVEQKKFLAESKMSIEEMGGGGNLYSDGDIFLESNSGLIEGGDLVSGGLVLIISEGGIRLNAVKSQGDILLYAKDRLDAKEIDAKKSGNIKLYGKQIEVENTSNAQDLIILGEELGRVKLSGIKNVEIADKKLLPKFVSPSSQLDEENVSKSTMNFYVDAPTDIEGTFKFAGKNFVSKNILNVKGDVILELSGILSNKESSDITVGGSWYSSSRRFGFLDKGQITADSIEIYLIEDNDKENYKGIYLGADAELKTREGGGGIKLVSPKGGIYLGYAAIKTGDGLDGEGYTYEGSKLLSYGGPIHIQSGSDVTFDGTKVLSNGDCIVEAKGDVLESGLKGRYVDGKRQVVVDRYEAFPGYPKSTKEVYGTAYDYKDFVLHPEFKVNGDKKIFSNKDVIFSAANSIIRDKFIVRAEGDIKFEALKVHNDLERSGSGDNMLLTSGQNLPAIKDQFGDDQLSAEVAFVGPQGGTGEGFVYKGSSFLTGGGIDIAAKGKIELQAPMFLTEGSINIESKEGSIIGMAMLGHYLDKQIDTINKEEIIYAITGSPVMLAALNSILLLAPEGMISLKGAVISAENVESVAKDIDLSAIHETVTQYQRENKYKLFSSAKRETWQDYTAAIFTEVDAQDVSLKAKDSVLIKGANIKIPDGVVKIDAKKIAVEDYKWTSTYKTVTEESGVSLPGIVGAAVDPHQGFGDSVVSYTPILNAIKEIRKTKSVTDLLPAAQLGTELLRILSANGWQEALTDQLGITVINGIPVPSGVGFYNKKSSFEQSKEESLPSVIKTQENTITGDDLQIIGSQIIGDKIDIDVDNFELKPSILKKEFQSKIEEERQGISYSSNSFGVQIGKGEGYGYGSGYDLEHSHIGGDKGSATSVNINAKNRATIASPIEADKVNIATENLLVETMQDIWDERSSYTSWSAGLTFIKGSPYPIPTGSYYRSLGYGDRKWAKIPVTIAGNNIYVDVEDKCALIGGGILGNSVTLNANSLAWQNIYNKDESEQKSFGFDSGVLMSIAKAGSGEAVSRSGSVVNGWLSFSDYGSSKEGVIRATISEGAKINLGEKTDLSGLNRDESKMVEITKDDEYAYSIGIPIIDVKELRSRWEARETLLQQMIGNRNLPRQEREFLETEQDVIEVVKEEAIKEGLKPEDVQDVIEELAEEKIIIDNLEKLNEYNEGTEITLNELEEVLSGKIPIKDEAGKIKFESVSKKVNDKDGAPTAKGEQQNIVGDYTSDIAQTDINEEIALKKEELKAKWREFIAEAGDLGISLVPVVGPPSGAAFSQVVKGERDDAKSLEGLAWGAFDFTVAGLLKKVKTGSKLASMVPKGAKLLEETKDVIKFKVVKNSSWKVGDDIYKATAKGTEPSWNTVKRRWWKNKAKDMTLKDAGKEYGEKYAARNLERMKQGKPPQKYSKEKFRKQGDGWESKELHHDPIPKRDGGKAVEELWPKEHAAKDKFRHVGY